MSISRLDLNLRRGELRFDRTGLGSPDSFQAADKCLSERSDSQTRRSMNPVSVSGSTSRSKAITLRRASWRPRICPTSDGRLELGEGSSLRSQSVISNLGAQPLSAPR